MGISSPANGRAFANRLSDALKRRLAPNTALQRKVLAGAIGVSRDTVDNWIDRLVEPRGHCLLALLDFFDDSFAREISGGTVTKLLSPRAIEASERRDEAEREYRKAMGGARMTEEEAKVKWCPFARVYDGDNNVSYNRWGNYLSPCIGSACMAWRWGEHQPSHVALSEGYCGLAGKP